MKKMVAYVEMERHNVTPAQFLAAVRATLKRKNIQEGLSLDLRDFRGADGGYSDTYNVDAGVNEVNDGRPYSKQVYLKWNDGTVYNEICQFDFDDEKTGYGYFFHIEIENVDEDEDNDGAANMAAADETETAEEEEKEEEEKEEETENSYGDNEKMEEVKNGMEERKYIAMMNEEQKEEFFHDEKGIKPQAWHGREMACSCRFPKKSHERKAKEMKKLKVDKYSIIQTQDGIFAGYVHDSDGVTYRVYWKIDKALQLVGVEDDMLVDWKNPCDIVKYGDSYTWEDINDYELEEVDEW